MSKNSMNLNKLQIKNSDLVPEYNTRTQESILASVLAKN